MCVRVHYINNYNSFTTENFHIYIYIYFLQSLPSANINHAIKLPCNVIRQAMLLPERSRKIIISIILQELRSSTSKKKK